MSAIKEIAAALATKKVDAIVALDEAIAIRKTAQNALENAFVAEQTARHAFDQIAIAEQALVADVFDDGYEPPMNVDPGPAPVETFPPLINDTPPVGGVVPPEEAAALPGPFVPSEAQTVEA